MLGLRFFSILTLLLASLFIQKSFDVSPFLYADEEVRSTEKLPLIQTSELVKLAIKKKSPHTLFIAPAFLFSGQKTLTSTQNISGFFVYFPKPTFENPSRAPPVV